MENDNPMQEEGKVPQPQTTENVFNGPITPADQVTLLEFLNNHTSTTAAAGRSHGTSDTSIAGLLAAQEKVAFNANDFATGITWDSGNSRFTALTAGKYAVTGAVGYTGAVSGKQYRAMIFKNGSEVSRVSVHASVSGAVTPIVSDILSLAVGDYVEIFTENSEAIAGTLYNTSTQTYITIAFIA